MSLASCGRLGFDANSDGGHVSTLHDGTVDTPTSTVCGDGVCVASLGETCVSCATDCKTQTPVCGNLACEAGEDGTTCPTDCGPVPWPWGTDEAMLLALINDARTAGVNCPASTSTVTAAELASSAQLQAAARDLAWEEAQYGTVNTKRCDGEAVFTYLAGVDANNERMSDGAGTPQSWLDAWKLDTNACPQLVDTARTTIGVAVAVGAQTTTYVVLMH